IQMQQIEGRFDPTPLLDDPDALVRCTAAWACGRTGVRDAEPKLVDLLKSGFATQRREAARAIGALGHAEGAAALRALAREMDPLVRAAAQEALAKLEAK